MRDYIRQTILKDVPQVIEGQETPVTFSDEQLIISARWACVEIAMHTAQQASIFYTCDGASPQFDLPDDIVDNIEKSGLVIHNNGQTLECIAPIRMLPSMSWPSVTPAIDSADLRGFWQWPDDRLTLSFVPATASKLELRYFKVWTPPEGDASMLEFPIQFEQPFAYFVGAACFDPLGAQASAIRQWNRKTDSGIPTDNALHEQSKFYLTLAKERLRDIGPQDRETFYRIDQRDTGFKR